ncbi:MAG: ubiquinone/menaquinone biosynthesis methyltransferase [Planctomycetota bacterium]
MTALSVESSSQATEASRLGGKGVREMFGRITPQYDFLNRLLSFRQDVAWRKLAVKESGIQSGDRVLDLCCGTGDLGLEFARAGARVTGMDFCRPMLQEARKKGLGLLAEADTSRLPVKEGQFDVVSAAFGIRNVVDYRAALSGMVRALKPGGRLVILEFSSPERTLSRAPALFYLEQVLPRVASLIGDGEAYSYLSRSVGAFPNAQTFSGCIAEAGCPAPRLIEMNFGTVGLHVGVKPSTLPSSHGGDG